MLLQKAKYHDFSNSYFPQYFVVSKVQVVVQRTGLYYHGPPFIRQPVSGLESGEDGEPQQ